MNRVLVMALAAMLLFAGVAAAKNEKPVPVEKHKTPVTSTATGAKATAHHAVSHRTRVSGTITAMDATSMTVQRKTPAAVKGHKPPTAPAPITVKLTDKTKWYFDGKPGSASNFAVGDKVVVKLGPELTALGVADPKSVGKLFGVRHRAKSTGTAHKTVQKGTTGSTHAGSTGETKGK